MSAIDSPLVATGPERFAPSLEALARPIDGLHEDPANVRRHDARNLASIRASLARFGQQKPIVIRPDGSTVAGAGTLAAARALGWLRLAVVVSDLAGPDATAYGIADNRTAELATWDDAALAALLRDLKAEDDALLVAAGFDDAALAALLADGNAGAGPGGGAEAGPEGDGAGSLAAKFLLPPFSVLDARSGPWQERKRAWLALGIKSELGRAEGAPGGSARPAASLGADGKTERGDGAGRSTGGTRTWVGRGRDAAALDDTSRKILAATDSGASVFDPVLCELAYRWFAPPGGRVLDPFAGGSVRGVVASRLGRSYVGVELRPEQVAANVDQAADLVRPGDPAPLWITGDARDVRALVAAHVRAPEPPAPFDLVFGCPPYADLEVYSDDPRDLSTMTYLAFLEAYRAIIRDAVALLAPDRFAVFVVGEVRGKAAGGAFRGFVPDTIRAFEDAGARFYNEAVLVTAVGSLSLRAGRAFEVSRKLGKTHQNVLVFAKGNPRKATAACGPVEVATGDPEEEGDRDEAPETVDIQPPPTPTEQEDATP